MEARLYDKYVTEVVPALQQKFGYKNVNQIPKIDKIVINMGLGDCKDNPKALEVAVKELEARGLVASCFMVVNDGSYAAGCVVRASEEPGTKVAVGTVITVYIAADPSVQITTPEEPAATEPTTEPETPEAPTTDGETGAQ